MATEVDAPDLSDLLARIARKDESALGSLYDATSSLVFGVAYKLLKDQGLTEEVTADVYVKVWKAAASYSPARGTPQGWLARIARNQAIDRLRSARARPAAASLSDVGDVSDSSERNPAEESVHGERSREVLAAVERLPEAQRRAIDLAFFHGLSHSQIAERLGVPLGTVKTQVRLGMTKLRGSLNRYSSQ